MNDVALPTAAPSRCAPPRSRRRRAGGGIAAAPSNASTLRHRCRYSVVSRVCRHPDGMMMPQQTAVQVHTARPGIARPSTRAPPSVAPGRSSSRNRFNCRVRIGQVANQIGRQDAVERALDGEVGEILDAAVDESHRRRPPLCPRLAQHPFGRVDRNDLGVRRGGQQRGSRRAGAAARVEQPSPAAVVGNSHAVRRHSQMIVVAGVCAHHPVVCGRADVERRGTPCRAAGRCHRRSRCRSHNNSTAVTSAKPNRKSSTGMSNGNRRPLVWLSS